MNVQTTVIDKRSIADRWAALRGSWFWKVVLAPFGITRLAWVLAAAFAQGNFLPNPTYAKYAQQGGQFTRIWLLDIFARWDARFYLSIIEQGYIAGADLANQYSNVAFYPLYPFLVKSIGWLGIHLPTAGYLAIGLLLSNLCFLGAMALLYRLAVEHCGLSEKAARRAILLLTVFPGGLFFSAFYTESLYLFLSLLGFWAAQEKRWWLVGVAGALVTLTRIQGLLVVGILGLMYLQSTGWRLKALRADILWFGLAPLAAAAHMFGLYRITGLALAPFQAQAAWGRGKYGFFEGLGLQLEAPVLDVYKIDALLLLFFLGCGIYLLLSRRSKIGWALGLYAVLMCVIPVSTGLLISVSRFLAVVFPVFLLLGEALAERDELFGLCAALLFTLQVIYFAGWTNYYWIA